MDKYTKYLNNFKKIDLLRYTDSYFDAMIHSFDVRDLKDSLVEVWKFGCKGYVDLNKKELIKFIILNSDMEDAQYYLENKND